MKKYFIILIVLAIGFAAYAARIFFEPERLPLSHDQYNNRWLQARPEDSQLKSGDLIFRHGRGFISNALMSFGQREKKYSHAGIISVENGNVFVYHAIGGEENISNKLRKDPLSEFCSPAGVHAFGIYRTDLNEAQVQSVVRMAATYFSKGLEFDTKFDLSSDDRMYCTEFVYKIFSNVLGNQNYISLSAFSGKQFITCDDLYANAHCKAIYTYQYKN